MGLIASDSGGTFTPPPQGTHIAVCCQVIDLGTQFSKFYGKEQHKVMVGWELPEEKNDDGAPWLVWRRYTLSLGENATLRAHLESWRGRVFTQEELQGFDLSKIIGVGCMLNITHREDNGRTYGDVATVMALKRGTPTPKMTRSPVVFDVTKWDDRVFATFSEKLQKTIMESKEARSRGSEQGPVQTGGGDLDLSDIPFGHEFSPCMI